MFMTHGNEKRNMRIFGTSENERLFPYEEYNFEIRKFDKAKCYESMDSNESLDGARNDTVILKKEYTDLKDEGESSSIFFRNDTEQSLGLISLAVIVFYNVSGGPFGIEESVRASGSFFAIMGYIIAPIFWSIPEALVTAELGSTFPEASGPIAWVEEAFGKKAGIVDGYLGWISGVTDNAIYPALFLEYLTSIMSKMTEHEKDELNSGFPRFLIVSLLTAVLTAINYSGLHIVGTSSIVICIISMSPFVIMCIIGIPQIDPRRWFELPDTSGSIYNMVTDENDQPSGPLPIIVYAGIFLRPFANNLFWNLNSFDAAASFAADTKDARNIFPKGMFLGLGMTILFYLIPLLVAIGATESKQSDWVDGHLASVALEIGGPLLGGWTVFAAGISNLALFEAEMSADALKLMGMAERGYLPKFFATRSKRFGTPVYGILTGFVIIIFFGMADFSQLVEMLNFCYSISLLMEYAAFVKLRFSHEHLDRPYRVPVSKWGAVLFVVPPIAGIIFIFLISSWATLSFAVFVLVLGILLHELHRFAVVNDWCEFVNIPTKPSTDQANFNQDRVVYVV